LGDVATGGSRRQPSKRASDPCDADPLVPVEARDVGNERLDDEPSARREVRRDVGEAPALVALRQQREERVEHH
jgi:hypothetical protein